jgi:hypothetical protein
VPGGPIERGEREQRPDRRGKSNERGSHRIRWHPEQRHTSAQGRQDGKSDHGGRGGSGDLIASELRQQRKADRPDHGGEQQWPAGRNPGTIDGL